jgi:hypothetical protein
MPLLLPTVQAHGLEGRVLGLPTMLFPHYDVIIFVSPEYRPHYVREFIHRSKPKLVVLFVHNGDAQSVPELLKVHSNAHLMTLSPHVQQYVSNRLGRPVKWMLPLMEVKPRTVTRACNAADCLGGFAIQVCEIRTQGWCGAVQYVWPRSASRFMCSALHHIVRWCGPAIVANIVCGSLLP